MKAPTPSRSRADASELRPPPNSETPQARIRLASPIRGKDPAPSSSPVERAPRGIGEVPAGDIARLSRWGYYADFVVYPVLIVALMLLGLWRAAPGDTTRWLLAACAGLSVWTGLEYVLHRCLLHRLPILRTLHESHHHHPGALIGTPTWVSAGLFFGLWGMLEKVLAGGAADGVVAGLMTGYLVYVIVHDAVHHRSARHGSWLYQCKIRHAQHHRPGAHCNFGVSTGFWDTVCGTAAARQTGSN
ncbi:MAG: sterol desaturase family protein [Ideonella sp.]